MTSAHGQEHEQLLEALVTGEREEGEVRAALASCPECCAELEQLVDAMALLDDVGSHERETMEEAATLSAVPGEASVDRVIYGLADAPGPRQGPRLLLVGSVLALAAAALLVVMLNPFGAPDSGGAGAGGAGTIDPVPEIMLGPGDDLTCIEPVGEVSGYDVFRWEGQLPQGWGFVVEVRGAGRGITSSKITSKLLTANEWRPDAQAAAALIALSEANGGISWEVLLEDAFGENQGYAEAEASLP